MKLSEYESKSSKEWGQIFKEKENLNCLVLDLKEKQKENLPSNFAKIVFDQLKLEDDFFFSKEISESAMGKHIFVLRKIRKISSDDLRDDVIKEIQKETLEKKYSSEIQKIRDQISDFNSEEKNHNEKSFNFINLIGNKNLKEKKIFKSEDGYFSDQINLNEIKNSRSEESDEIIFDNNLNQNIFSSKENSINLFQINDKEYIIFQIGS